MSAAHTLDRERLPYLDTLRKLIAERERIIAATRSPKYRMVLEQDRDRLRRHLEDEERRIA